MKDNTKRFSDRVADYTKYRPSYPREVIEYISQNSNLSPDAVIADIGSGTGILTELLVSRCKTVYAVEPNDEMRKEAERRLHQCPSYVSINGTAERTGLPDQSVHAITVAQAFHWFDPDRARQEFSRILVNGGYVYLLWNKRTANTEFMAEYEDILSRDIPERAHVTHENVTPEILQRFIPTKHRLTKYSNNTTYNLDELIGRLRSSSYTPKPHTKEYELLENKVRDLFHKHSRDGMISFNHETEVYSGRLS